MKAKYHVGRLPSYKRGHRREWKVYIPNRRTTTKGRTVLYAEGDDLVAAIGKARQLAKNNDESYAVHQPSGSVRVETP